MRKYFLLALQLAFFISSLLFFEDNISLIFCVLLMFYLSFENKYYSIIPLAISVYFEGFYIIIAVSTLFLILFLDKIIHRNRFYHLALFIAVIVLINLLEYILSIQHINTLIISGIALILYGVINMFYIFKKENNTYLVTSINDKLITLTLLLGYLILFTFYSNNYLLLLFLFMQLYLLKDFKYNIIFFVCYIFLQLYTKQSINVNSFGMISTSFLPISISILLDYKSIKTYLYILYALLITIFSYEKKTLTFETNYIDNLFKDFKKYIDGLNLEYNRLYSIKKIKDNHLESIIKNYCKECKRNTALSKREIHPYSRYQRNEGSPGKEIASIGLK